MYLWEGTQNYMNSSKKCFRSIFVAQNTQKQKKMFGNHFQLGLQNLDPLGSKSDFLFKIESTGW